MSQERDPPPTIEMEFTLKEQWTIHQAFLNYIKMAISENTDNLTPNTELTILEKLEGTDPEFTWFELERIRYECNHHRKSENTPNVDQTPAKSVVNKINKLYPSEFDYSRP